MGQTQRKYQARSRWTDVISQRYGQRYNHRRKMLVHCEQNQGTSIMSSLQEESQGVHRRSRNQYRLQTDMFFQGMPVGNPFGEDDRWKLVKGTRQKICGMARDNRRKHGHQRPSHHRQHFRKDKELIPYVIQSTHQESVSHQISRKPLRWFRFLGRNHKKNQAWHWSQASL